MSSQPICTDLLNATSLLASACGATPCVKPDGPTPDPCGPAPAPASLSPRRAKELGLLTSGTYGQRGFISLRAVDLKLSLENRLKQRSNTDGSTLFKLTWKEVITPARRCVFLLRASGRRTSEADCTSWPTPQVHDTHEQSVANGMNKNGRLLRENGSDFGAGLAVTAKLASWPTPNAQDGVGAAQLASWATPRANDAEKRGQPADDPRNGLVTQAAMTSWATPAARDFAATGARKRTRSNTARRAGHCRARSY
jgi:hypothetical protein